MVNNPVTRVSFFYFDWWLGGGIIHPTFRSQAPALTIQELSLSLLQTVPRHRRPDAGSHAIMFRELRTSSANSMTIAVVLGWTRHGGLIADSLADYRWAG